MAILKRTLALCLISMLAVSAWAVPAYRGWRTVTQPDGTTITIRQMGDEFFHYWETKDGRIVSQQADGSFVVTNEASPDEEQVAARRRASRMYQARVRKVGASSMPARGLFILVSFNDKAFKSSSETYYKTKLGDATEGAMSMYNYLKEQSNGAYAPPIDVYGPVTLSHNVEYYGGNNSSGDDQRPASMIKEACQLLDATINFSQYDNNNDGVIDNVYVIYAGKGEADGGADETIWPHQWDIYSAEGLSCTLDGKSLKTYACSAELNGDGNCAMGTPLHEFSHVLGLPDYYVTSKTATNYPYDYTPGAWSLMDYGSYNDNGNTPPNYSVYDKYYLGWATPTLLKQNEAKNVTVTTAHNSIYQITGNTSSAAATSTNRVWYLENRQKTGWDAYLPGHGLCVWEVLYSSTAWNNNNLNNSSVRYTIVTANNLTRPYEPCVYSTTASSTSGTPFPGTSHITSYTPATGCALTEITESSGTITFKYNGGEDKTRANYEFVTDHCSTPADGDVAINAALSVTITPNSGYTLDDASCWTVEMGGVELTYGSGFTYNASTNTFYIASLTDDVVIMAEAKLIRTVTWSVQGSTSATTFADGAALVLPSQPEDCSGTGGKKFVGWTASSSVSGSAPADLFTEASGTVNANTTYYAVYATASGSGGGGTSGNVTITTSTANIPTSYGSANTFTEYTLEGYKFKIQQMYLNSGKLQWRASGHANGTGTMYNNEAFPGEIASIVLTYNSSDGNKNFIVKVGNSSNPSSGTSITPTISGSVYTFDCSSANADYFVLTNGSGAGYLDQIVINYGGGGGTSYSDYSLVCGTPCSNTPSMSFTNETVNKTTADVTYTQAVTITGKGSGQTVAYSSSDESVATVNSSGVVTLQGIVGSTTITASVLADGDYCAASASYTLNVTAAPIDVTLYYNNTSATLNDQPTPYTLPTGAPYNADMCEGDWTFAGWYGSTYTKSETAPTYITQLTATGSAYAIYTTTETSGSGGGGTSGNVTITTSTANIPTSYGSANTFTEYTLEGYKFKIQQMYLNSGKLQWRAAGNSNGTGTMYNNETFPGKITSIVLTYNSSDTNKNFTVKVGNAANPSSGTSITPTISGSVYTFDCSSANADYFVLTNGSGAGYLDQIVINYGGGGSSTTYYTTSPDCPTPCANEITITKGSDPVNGTFVLSNSGTVCIDEGNASTTVTAEPNDHYHLETVTTTGDVGSVGSISGNTCTITGINANTTINVTFAADPKDVVYWYVAGTPTAEEKYAGETLAGITAPTESDCDGKAFVGWTATADYSSETDAPDDLFNDPTTKTMPTGGTNYYAVFADGTTSGGPSNLIEYDGSGIVTLEEIDGVSQNGVSTYAAGNAPYLLKFDGNGDYIQFNLTSVPATLSFNYKMIGGGNTSTMTIKECATADGSYTDVQALTISGAQNSTGTLTTTTSFTKKYVRMVFTKGSNVGVGAITITGTGGGATYSNYSTSCVECTNKVTLTKGTESNGYFTLNKADGEYENCAVGGLVVHVTDITPDEDYQFKEITQEGIDAGVTIDNDAKTVTYAKDVDGASTITVLFELKPTYTIRFYNGESLIGSAQTVVSGNLPSVPSNPEACEGYTFEGWWTTSLPANNTESHIWISDFTATGNRDYYAVYRHNEGGSGGGNVSFVSSDLYTNGAEATAKTIDGVTFTFDQGDNSSNAPRYYSSGTSVRMYADNTLTISAESSITAIAFTFGGTTSAGLDANTGTYNAGSWSGEATSITFTAGASGQQHIQSILVTVDGGGTNYYTSVFSCSGHMITVAEVEHGSGVSDKSRCDEGGAVTITLTADEGYECGGITTLPVVATTQMAECTYTFSMPDADITVTPVFTPKTPRTFTFEKGTGICETSTLTESVWNGGVTLPTATANSGCDPEYVFAGWAKAAVTTETEVRPTLYAAGTLYNEEETTLYAVYSQTTGGSASGFTLSYTHNDVTYYVAARTGSNTYMDASTDAADAARFSIVTSNDKKYLCWHGENDTYVHNSGNNTTLKFTTELANASDWTVTEEGTSITLRNSTSGRYFMFNTNQKDRFSSYASEGSLTKGDAGTTVYNTNPSCICYSVNITYNANGGTLAEGCGNVVGGECERDWKLCEAPTREGYLFTNWKDQNGTLYNAGAMVQDLKLSLTLTAQWIPAPYTVLFDAGTGTCVASLTEPSRGDGITLPKAEPSAACADDWTFVGWSATELVGETNTTATIIGVAGVPYVPTTNNVTLYAVYSTLDEAGATSDYTRVSASTPEEGDYAIVVSQSDESFGLLTYGTISKGRLAYTKAYTSLPASTISSPAATQIWHLTYDASGYAYLYNANAGAYLSASGTNIDYNANGGSAFVLTRDPGTYGDYQCLNSTASASSNYYLGANKDADYVRYYGTSNIIATNSVTLYAGSTGTRYYATSPVCTPCTDPEWSFELGTSVVKTKGSAPFTNTVIKVHESSGSVTYSSTNEAVATIDAAGEVTLVGTGSTTITLRLTKAMPYCAAVLQYELEVKEPSIDIVGVTPDGEIVIEHDLEGTITLDLSEGQAISTGTAANDLFFSKYFEAASNMKLFAIFNGTGHDMDISNIRVRCNCTTDGKWPTKTGDLGYVELRTISKLREQYPKLKIPSGTELIFWSNNKGSTPSTAARNTELRECITFIIGEMEYHYSDMEAMEIPNWFCLGDYTTFQTPDADGNNQFVFNGDDSMIMERYNPATGQWEAIDLFGAGTSEYPADTDGLVEKIETKYIINGVSQELNDGTGFHELCTDSIIPFSTNRYMLVRKNTVLDGMHAVASNTSSFATLCEEWNGTPVGGSADGYCRSGNVFSDIAEYDYAENYIDWTGINDDAYTVTENADGTVSVYFNTPLDLDARACTLLKIEVHDKDDASKILATTEYKIPIVVKAGEHMTTEELFYHQGEKCATCDVAILGSATLTKATDGATNDMPEVRDIYVYGGGQLVIPSGTHYRAHDLIMRMEMAADKVNVAVPDIRAVGSLSNQYGGAIRQQVRVGTSRFYQFAVPYPVRLEDVTFSDGTPAVYGDDFMIRYYDGESRAQNLGTASNWKNFEGTELQPGVGYTLAVAKKAGHEQRELIFPMADASLAEGEPATKTTAIHAWGDNTIRANHRGWNFLSNPYLTTYGRNNLDDDAGGVLTTGRLIEDPDHPGWWVNDAGTIPYVTLINGTRTDYTQERVALQDLPPFTTFFIQAGDDTHNSGEESTLTFNRDHRATSAPAYMRAEQKAPVTHFGVLLNGNNATDNCGMAIGEDYSAAYDMQADLSKEFGSAYSLKLYTLQEDAMRMAFLATHPDSLNKPIPVGVRMPANAEYTFSIDRRYNLGAFAHIYLTDNVTGQHTDLLEDTYSFAGTRSQNDARFSLFVVMKKNIPTGTDNLLNGIYAVGREGAVMLTGLPKTADIYIYDMNGRLVLNRHTHGATSVTYHMPIGVYQIRIHSEGANALLRTIVH